MQNNLELTQKQSLSQTQIQSLEIMNLCNQDLYTFLNEEYMENPLMDKIGESAPGEVQEFGEWYSHSQTFNEGYGSEDKEENNREIIPAKQEGADPETYLKEQLNKSAYTESEWKLIEYLIQNLDDNGFYPYPVSEAAKSIGVSEETAEKCMKDLKSLEPCGIFAENLAECLITQFEAEGIEDEILNQILREHLEDIAAGKISTITRHLKISSVQVRKYIAMIKTRNPRPLSGFYSGNTNYIVPDVIITQKDGVWDVSLNDEWIGNYSLNEYYIHMIGESKDESLKEYFQKKLERARIILNSIEQRRRTILTIAREILEIQKSFFTGSGELKVMTMSELADKLEIHPSTVSRAVGNKYLQYPGGVIMMKKLFTQKVHSDMNGEEMSALQIKKILKSLIEQEDKKKPYSDSKLVEELKKRGIILSRRAIAKYREEMNIKGSFDRKEI